MDLEHKGKAVVVTGSSRAIGRAIATAFAREGARVAINSRDAEALGAVAKEIAAETGAEVTPIAADMTDFKGAETLVEAAAAKMGGIDILVNNASTVVPAGNFLELTNETWLNGWNQKLQPYIRMCRAVWPVMTAKGEGVIVNVNGLASRAPRASYLPVGATNAAILNFTKGLAELGAEANIRVMGVAPSGVDTERFRRQLGERAEAEGRSYDELWAEAISYSPMKRLCSTDEVADAVCFFASPRAGYIAGSTISLDGGAVRGLFT